MDINKKLEAQEKRIEELSNQYQYLYRQINIMHKVLHKMFLLEAGVEVELNNDVFLKKPIDTKDYLGHLHDYMDEELHNISTK